MNLTDILPTCLEAGGAEAIACDGKALQGRTEFLEYTFSESEGFCAVTDGKYKYIHVQKEGHNHREFLDLINDPSAAGEKARLMERLITHFMPHVLP